MLSEKTLLKINKYNIQVAPSRIKVDKIMAYVDALQTALGFYSDSYQYGDGNGLSWECAPIAKDRGKIAREALGRIKDE